MLIRRNIEILAEASSIVEERNLSALAPPRRG